MKRIFIAVSVNAEAALLSMFSTLRSGLREANIKWTATENLHITLVFLGDTDEDKIPAIATMLKERCQGTGSFGLELKGAGVFKSFKDPKILWAGIEPSEKLNFLNGSIKTGLKGLGIPTEDRPFSPHLTMARIRKIPDVEILKSLIEDFRVRNIQKSKIQEVILFESILSQTGSVYKPLGKFKLD